MTPDRIERIARRVCAARGLDPDRTEWTIVLGIAPDGSTAPVGASVAAWEMVAREVTEHLEVREAIEAEGEPTPAADPAKPLPCPFCGGTVSLVDWEGVSAWLACLRCGAGGPRVPGRRKDDPTPASIAAAAEEAAAVAAWNRRAKGGRSDG